MFNLIVAAELWVLIRDGMKTMRTGGHNHLWLRRIQSGDVLGLHLSEQVFIAGASRRISREFLFLAQHRPTDARRVKACGHAARDLPRARIKSRGSAHPVRNLRTM